MTDALQTLIALIQRFEGCRLAAYRCPAGIWTCGWGATGADVAEGTAWTQEHADARLEDDAQRFVLGTLGLCPGLEGNRLAAIADFAYNCGLKRLEQSTLRKRLNAGDWEGAKVELRKWVYGGGKKLGGLVIRRDAEAALL